MIRYDKNINSELVKAVRNYNAKISRLESKGVQTRLEKVSLRTIRREVIDRKELVSYIKEMRKFGQRGVERIAFVDTYKHPITEYELLVAKNRQKRAIRLAEKKIEQAEKVTITTGGEKEIETLMGTDYVSDLKANLQRLKEQKFAKTLSKSKKAKIVQASRSVLRSETRAKANQGNFFDILRQAAGFSQVPTSVVNHIESVLRKLDAVQWEMCRNGEQLIIALIEKYNMVQDAKAEHNKNELESLRIDIANILNQLDGTVDEIFEYYSGK